MSSKKYKYIFSIFLLNLRRINKSKSDNWAHTSTLLSLFFAVLLSVLFLMPPRSFGDISKIEPYSTGLSLKADT